MYCSSPGGAARRAASCGARCTATPTRSLGRARASPRGAAAGPPRAVSESPLGTDDRVQPDTSTRRVTARAGRRGAGRGRGVRFAHCGASMRTMECMEAPWSRPQRRVNEVVRRGAAGAAWRVRYACARRDATSLRRTSAQLVGVARVARRRASAPHCLTRGPSSLYADHGDRLLVTCRYHRRAAPARERARRPESNRCRSRQREQRAPCPSACVGTTQPRSAPSSPQQIDAPAASRRSNHARSRWRGWTAGGVDAAGARVAHRAPRLVRLELALTRPRDQHHQRGPPARAARARACRRAIARRGRRGGGRRV